MRRVLTALVLFPVAVYGTFFASQAVFIAIVAVMALLCFHEYCGIVAAHGIEHPGWLSYVAGLLVLLNPAPIVIAGIALLAAPLHGREMARVLPAAAAAVFGVVYVFGAWRTAIDLRALSPQWLFFALAINFVGDIAAYYTGRAIGRHKLAPAISPGKSWEGAAASMIAAIIFGVLWRPRLGSGIAFAEVILLAMAGNIAGQVGDLAESAIKRGAGLKDSGTLLPGHGGFLDRLDSSLFSMPVVYWLHTAASAVVPV
ncbi:MAG TPA: phosphatidate cytidylyltransferase [Bryobacteraceae bacterium]|nr:phosphatidate cytidylyltransferase [Bryobacteraceae bacterium]